jgi:hypothetical protein
LPQGFTHVPFWHSSPVAHGLVSEHSAQTWLLHAVALLPPFSQVEHSPSVEQLSGHFCSHLPSLQASEPRQCDLSCSVQATHLLLAVSHFWCIGSHAMQSWSELHVTVGVPVPSVGQVSPIGAQVPNEVHSSPSLQPCPVAASHATHRFSATLHLFRPNEQPSHSASELQLFSRQIPEPVAPEPPSVPPVPELPPLWPGGPLPPLLPPQPIGKTASASTMDASTLRARFKKDECTYDLPRAAFGGYQGLVAGAAPRLGYAPARCCFRASEPPS